MKCFFSGCEHDAMEGTWKCTFHIHRSRCAAGDCRNQVYARNLCVRHGGKRQCQVQGCRLNCRVGDYCTRHSSSEVLRFCSEEGCNSQVHLRGKCFRHGGGRRCQVEGCTKFARNRGLCARHTPKKSQPTLPSFNEFRRRSALAEVESLLTFYYSGQLVV
ncbi:hypothetical protein Ae201684P_019651 [Aphanomyces euteiches]|uniref:WRKY19-like zinc finger domain-containing protein n=1 Tax=Aphanomyces euteiches TaxID=100861 RepID=A0A6G0XEH6_9STRA|nr:hypothetical protein Ae201684_005618 [Aphanomyces euteiches]KAH9078569.1 hypothetical protein Ae201684P_019651 [Aphanomyces euteiches]